MLAHLAIPIVLGLAVVAEEDVQRQPQAPRRHQRQDQPTPCGRPRGLQGVDPRHEREPTAPEVVDDPGVALDQAEDPGQDHPAGDRRQADQPGRRQRDHGLGVGSSR